MSCAPRVSVCISTYTHTKGRGGGGSRACCGRNVRVRAGLEPRAYPGHRETKRRREEQRQREREKERERERERE